MASWGALLRKLYSSFTFENNFTRAYLVGQEVGGTGSLQPSWLRLVLSLSHSTRPLEAS